MKENSQKFVFVGDNFDFCSKGGVLRYFLAGRKLGRRPSRKEEDSSSRGGYVYGMKFSWHRNYPVGFI